MGVSSRKLYILPHKVDGEDEEGRPKLHVFGFPEVLFYLREENAWKSLARSMSE